MSAIVAAATSAAIQSPENFCGNTQKDNIRHGEKFDQKRNYKSAQFVE